MSDALPAKDPMSEFWLDWLRPLLIVGTYFGLIDLLVGLADLAELNQWIASTKQQGGNWMHPGVAVAYAQHIGIPLCLLIGCFRLLMSRNNGRMFLLVYCWVSIAYTGYWVLLTLWGIYGDGWGFASFDYVVRKMQEIAGRLLLPLCLLWVLTRAPVRALFVRQPEGFDVVQE